MSEFFEKIRILIQADEVRVSLHGYEELDADNLTAREVVAGIDTAVVVEEYPNYPKGSSILLLQRDAYGNPIHVVWGVPKGHESPVVLVTAYRPDPTLWDAGFMKRR